MIGGPNTHVEIDDIQFEVNKDKRDYRNRIKCRLFAAVNVENQQAVVVYYNDVDANLQIDELVRKHVMPGSIITHKGKAGYENITNLKNYDGSCMYEFDVRQDYLANLERLFAELRSNVGRKGLHSSCLEGYINRYMYWKKNPRDTLHHLLLDISSFYNIKDDTPNDSELVDAVSQNDPTPNSRSGL